MPTGKVMRFDGAKGYGFIAPDDEGEDVFVHANELMSRGLQVSTGTRVQFNVIDGGRGPKAYDVEIIDGRTLPPAGAQRATAGENGAAAEQAVVSGLPGGKPDDGDDELSEVFSKYEFLHLVTDIVLDATPELTGAQVVKLRDRFLEFAAKNGWAY
jgi:cold shock protein